MIGDRIHLSDEMLIALRRERAVLTAFPDGVPPNEHLARVLMREDRIAQVCAYARLRRPQCIKSFSDCLRVCLESGRGRTLRFSRCLSWFQVSIHHDLALPSPFCAPPSVAASLAIPPPLAPAVLDTFQRHWTQQRVALRCVIRICRMAFGGGDCVLLSF